ncbi:MAG: GAF domain-containing protein [Armatimonadetes bacterium]|nr:GAF domain-containing protein [Armatimonadota bacterium]MBS1725603.1 GAF domain-containing protein [Armatimonadota bacterium]
MRELLPPEIEHSLRAVLGAVDYGILVTDLEHQSLICNGKFGELFGISIEKVLRNDVMAVRRMVRDRIIDVKGWEVNLDEVYADPAREQEDELILRNPKTVLRRYTGPVRNEQREVVARLWTFLDVTLGSQKQRYQTALSEIAILFHHDPTQVVKKIIDKISVFYGSVSLLSILDDAFLRFHTAAGVPEGAPNIRGNDLTDSFCQFCLAVSEPLIIQDARLDERCRDLFPLRMGFTRYAGVPIYDPEGHAIGTLCILDDRSDERLTDDDLDFLSVLAMRISSELEREARIRKLEDWLATTTEELRGAQDKLVQSEKLAVTGTLAASVAHDIRNILSSIGVQISLGSHEPEKALDYVQDSLGRFNVLAHRLLSYARPQKAVLEHLDLCMVLEKVLSLIQAQFRISKVELEMSMPDDSVYVMGDEGRLEHLIVNLLLNSLNAVGSGGKVSICIEADDEQVVLLVSDNGPGISEEIRNRLFEPFSSTRSNGFGLGLYSCRQIAIEHKGNIDCQSDVGRGTTMKVTFPRAK